VHLHGPTLIHIRGTTNRLVFRLCRRHTEQREWIQETKDRSWCGRCKPDADKEATDDTTVQSDEFRSARELSLRYDLQHLQTGVLLIGQPLLFRIGGSATEGCHRRRLYDPDDIHTDPNFCSKATAFNVLTSARRYGKDNVFEPSISPPNV
jgi:hypothetical protein